MAANNARRALYSHEQVGAAIRALREKRNLSQTRLAHLAEVDRPALVAYERGLRWATFPSYDKILCAMNAEWDEFGATLKRIRDEQEART